MSEELKIVRLKGSHIIPYIPELAKLRMDIFKDYPYLYLGSMEYETNYLQTYVKCSESVMVLVFMGDKVVGVSTAIPLIYETSEFQKPFLDQQMNIENIFYFGESLLRPEYRGQHIYRQFFHEREASAKEYGSKIAAFAAVERSINDPRRPKNYISLDKVWSHFGYKKQDELCAYCEWQEIGEEKSSFKPLVFWLKEL